jgi:hypothetical protein
LPVAYFPGKSLSLATTPPLAMHPEPVSFPDWKDVLGQTAMGAATQSAFAREIITFLKHCKGRHAAATTQFAKQYLVERERQTAGPAREALRWFYVEGRRRAKPVGQVADPPPRALPMAPSPRMERFAPDLRRALHPPPAASDTGTTPWEQELIRAMRERGLLWRTEQTYREWAVRFARFIAPRSPCAAAGEEVAAFLSELAVQGRASPSAQKQAA